MFTSIDASISLVHDRLQVVKHFLDKAKKEGKKVERTARPSANILGTFTLGFHNSHDCRELKRMLRDMGIDTNLVVPEGASVTELENLPKAWFNIVPYREVGLMSAEFLKNEYDQPMIDICPMGVTETARFVRAIEAIVKPQGHEFDFESYIDEQTRFVSQSAWFSRSIDCQNLTGKRAVVFGDATHAAAMTKVLVKESGVSKIRFIHSSNRIPCSSNALFVLCSVVQRCLQSRGI